MRSRGQAPLVLAAALISALVAPLGSLAQQASVSTTDSQPDFWRCFAEPPPGEVPTVSLGEGLRLVEVECAQGSVGSLQLGIYRLEWQGSDRVWRQGEQLALLKSALGGQWWYRLGSGSNELFSLLPSSGDQGLLGNLFETLEPSPKDRDTVEVEPCGADPRCQSWSSWIIDQRVAYNGQGLRRLDRVQHRSRLGWQGVAHWLSRALDGVPAETFVNPTIGGSPASTGVHPWIDSGLPRSSWLTWTLTSRIAGRSDPIERHWNLPAPSSVFPELELPARVVSGSPIPPSAVSPPVPFTSTGGFDLVSKPAIPIVSPAGEAASGTLCPGPVVHVPRATPKGYGFEWSWHPLVLAETDLFTGGETSTNLAGCLPASPTTEFAVELRNDRVHIQSLAAFDQPPGDSWDPVAIRVPQQGPYAFLQPGGTYREKLVAANIFGWLNRGVDRFAVLDPSLGGKVVDLEVSQWRNLEDCAGHWPYPGKIYLPFACPLSDSFVSKGMCPDVVLHELTHEVIGRAVRQVSHQGPVDGDLFEALADHFAMSFRGETGDQPSFFRFGLNCQNDYRVFDLEKLGSGLSRRNLQVVLGSLRQLDLDAKEGEVFDKLLTLAVRLAPDDLERFAHYLVDLAVKEKSLDIANEVCQAFVDHAGHCDDLCKGRSLCSGFTKIRRVGDQLTVAGRFLGSIDQAPEPSCKAYALKVEDLASGQQIDCLSGESAHVEEEFDLPPDTGPLILRLQACPTAAPDPCSATKEAEKDEARFETVARIEGWPAARQQSGQHLVTQLAYDNSALADFSESPPLLGITATGDFGVVSTTGLRTFEVAEEGADEGKDYRLGADASTTEGGQVQGWSLDGRQFTTHLEEMPEGWRWRWVSGDRRPRGVEWESLLRGNAETVLATDPRVELLSWDTTRLTVGDWRPSIPKVRSLPWPEPIDPASLQVLWSPRGPVLSVEQRFPRQVRLFRINQELALVDVKTSWLVQPIEVPGLRVIRWQDGQAEHNWTFRIDESLCLAPPFLAASVIDVDADSVIDCGVDRCRLAVLTCDGHLARLDLSAEQPVWSRPKTGDPTVPLKLHGVVPSIGGLRPLQAVTFNGGPEHWLAGPLRARDETGRFLDRLWILDEDLQIVPLVVPISTFGPVLASPVMTKVKERKLVLLLAEDGVEIWEPAKHIP